MKFDSLIILSAINAGFCILSTIGKDEVFFLIMAVAWLVLALIVGSKE